MKRHFTPDHEIRHPGVGRDPAALPELLDTGLRRYDGVLALLVFISLSS